MADKVIIRKKMPHRSTKEELEGFTKEELIDRVIQLESHNFQLKKIIERQIHHSKENGNTSIGKAKKNFDFSKSSKRHIFLKLYYLGWDYQGFAVQENTIQTIEYHLFSALTKSCLIENRESSNYHRCGRTDKGVSAFSQVISIDIRSCLDSEHQDDLENELDYCKILNRLLPKNIKCIAWGPAEINSSARFDCKWRLYKYFFPRGNLNIHEMNRAAQLLIGTHDFRNLCKMDVANGVINFTRSIIDAQVSIIKQSQEKSSGYDMCELTIKSPAFLWHQIRCIMGVLLLIGRGLENAEVISDLLNIKKYPKKPQYHMSHYLPLNLYSCTYENNNWYISQEELLKVIKNLQEEWTFSSIKSSMTKSMLNSLESLIEHESKRVSFQSDYLLQGVESKIYTPLNKRITCESLEDRIEHYKKKRKIEGKIGKEK